MSNRRKTRPARTLPRLTLAEAADLLSHRAGLFVLEHRHNDGCPTIRTQNAELCTCGDDVEVRLVAPFGSRPRQEPRV